MAPSQLTFVTDLLDSVLVTLRSSLPLSHADIFIILCFKEIARQLCLEHQLSFSKMVHTRLPFPLLNDFFVLHSKWAEGRLKVFLFRLLRMTTLNS